jgi:hypothetical protein
MKLKINKPPGALPTEGTHGSTVKAVIDRPERKKVGIEFTLPGYEKPFPKEYPRSLDPHTPLFQEAQTIQGRRFTELEVGGDFDLDQLVGKPCQVVIAHRRTAGGRVTAVVSVVLPAAQAVQSPAGAPASA